MTVYMGINVGAAFTTGIFSADNGTQAVKVETVLQKPTRSLVKCIEEGTKKLGFTSAHHMLRQTETVRLSAPLIGQQILRQKTGPKLGLIVTKGFEQTLYATRETARTAIYSIISRDMVAGVEEEIDKLGRQI